MSELPVRQTREEKILQRIKIIRGVKVILDSDLASLYGVETKRLNEQVRRNIKKFPHDFMFQLSENEFRNLRSQNAASSPESDKKRKKIGYIDPDSGQTSHP